MCSSSPDLGPVLCEVPCSRDCVLSDWTLWSTCSQTCSSKAMEGKQMRMRSILAYNAGEGGSAAVLPLKLSSQILQTKSSSLALPDNELCSKQTAAAVLAFTPALSILLVTFIAFSFSSSSTPVRFLFKHPCVVRLSQLNRLILAALVHCG